MNIKQAYYIKTIAQEGSITAAAKKLFISQPSLSQMLRQVEAELGVPIFNRNVSRVTLTYAGEKYLQAAEAVLVINERLENQIQEIKNENSGRIKVGISVQRAMQILPLVIPRFSFQYPHVSIELVEKGSAFLEDMVSDGQVDIAFAAIESTSPYLTYQLMEREKIGVLAGKQSSLATKIPISREITLDEAIGDSFVCLKEGHSLRLVQDKLFKRLGMNPDILLETDTLEVAKRVAMEAGACMLCSDIFIDETAKQNGMFYPLGDYENHRHFYACYRKGDTLPKYMSDFVEIVTEVISEKSNGKS